MLASSNVTMQFGSKSLLENISAKFGGGNRHGLIGVNGSGKPTFMKILDGGLEPTPGSVSLDPNKRIGKLRQDQFASGEFTVFGTVVMGHAGLWGVKQERDRTYTLAEISEEDNYGVVDLEAQYSEMDNYFAEARTDELLLGVDTPVEQHYGSMSGVVPGWRLRVLPAQALFSNPDILLLDEPTNNLDIDTIHRLEQTLNECDSTMTITSHDRHFLDMVCTHVADLDYDGLHIYPDNCDKYMTAAAQACGRLLIDNAKKKAQIADLQSFVSRFSANAPRSRQVTSRICQIDKTKLGEVEASSRRNPLIRFEQDKKLSHNALEAEALTKGLGKDPPFKSFNLLLGAGERVAIIGANNVGRSAMLKALVGDLQPDSGIVRWSENVQVDYYARDHEYKFGNDLTVSEWMSQWRQEGDDEQVVRSFLDRLLSGRDDIKKLAKVLPDGEKGRMLFGKLMMQKSNILAMDEPTNHLDMESIESLSMALEMYQGALIFISHDHEFISLLTTYVIEVTPERVIDFTGNYEDYLHSKGTE